jgi:hypothetical protein
MASSIDKTIFHAKRCIQMQAKNHGVLNDGSPMMLDRDCWNVVDGTKVWPIAPCSKEVT